MKNFNVDAIAFPLVFLPIIIILLLIFSLRLYYQSRKRSELYVSMALILCTIISFIPYNINGEERLRFWSSPFHFATLSFVLVHITFKYFNFKKVKKLPIVSLLLGVVTSSALLLSPGVAGTIVGLSLIAYGIYVFLKFQSRFHAGRVTGALLIASGLFAFLGQWLSFSGIRFLFSLFLVILLLNEALQYFDRIVTMMKTASVNSITDSLTGLYNKRFLQKKMEQLGQTQEIGVIFANIDNFKELNDAKGHDDGDIVIQKVGNTLKTLIGKNGYVSRFGGNEIVGGVVQGDATLIAETFRQRVEKTVGETISIGVAIGQGDGMLLIKKAEERMYLAKKSGKNKVVTTENDSPVPQPVNES